MAKGQTGNRKIVVADEKPNLSGQKRAENQKQRQGVRDDLLLFIKPDDLEHGSFGEIAGGLNLMFAHKQIWGFGPQVTV